MQVRDIMSNTVRSVPPDASVAQVARLVLDTGAPGVPVVDARGRLLGVVTDKDLVAKHARLHLPVYLGLLGSVLPLETHRTDEGMRHILGITARDIMSEAKETIAPDTDVDDAATIMVDRDVELLIVLEGDVVAGLVTRRDIVRLLVLEESDADEGT